MNLQEIQTTAEQIHARRQAGEISAEQAERELRRLVNGQIDKGREWPSGWWIVPAVACGVGLIVWLVL